MDEQLSELLKNEDVPEDSKELIKLILRAQDPINTGFQNYIINAINYERYPSRIQWGKGDENAPKMLRSSAMFWTMLANDCYDDNLKSALRERAIKHYLEILTFVNENPEFYKKCYEGITKASVSELARLVDNKERLEETTACINNLDDNPVKEYIKEAWKKWFRETWKEWFQNLSQ